MFKIGDKVKFQICRWNLIVAKTEEVWQTGIVIETDDIACLVECNGDKVNFHNDCLFIVSKEEFQIGDKVEYRLFSRYSDMEVGTIIRESSERYMVKTSIGVLDFSPENLKLFSGPITTPKKKIKCKKGDRVKIFGGKFSVPGEWAFGGKVGIVTRADENGADIEFLKDPPEKDFPHVIVCAIPDCNICIVPKVGDKVRIRGLLSEGLVGFVVCCYDDECDIRLENSPDPIGSHRISNYRLDVLVSQSDTFKVGDKVKTTKDHLGKPAGMMGYVTEIGKGVSGKCCRIENDIEWFWRIPEDLQLVTEEKEFDLSGINMDGFSLEKYYGEASKACEACKGPGKILLLTSYVDCDCHGSIN